MIRRFIDGVAAGVLIAIGGCVYLACDSKYVGAALFSVALLSICFKGYSLFTGKVGYLVNDHSRDAWSVLLLGLLGNAAATCGLGLLIHAAMPHLGQAALAICTAKLEQALLGTAVRSVLCGALMYLAVSIYKEKNTIAGILFCVPVFILSGFEHSIANMFYFGASGMVSFRAFRYICVVIAGNALGGMLFPLLDNLGKQKEAPHV